MRHVSMSHRVALDWLFDRINLDPKIQIKYIDTKNQLADILTKGNFTRDEWNHLLCLFSISHFSSTVCSETMTKRLQQDSGEERVPAKSRPMMSLLARVPSNVSSSTAVAPGREVMEVRISGVSIAKEEERLGRLDEISWTMTREVRLEETLRDRSERPDYINSQGGAWPQQFVIGNDEAELELSVESRSFVNRVNMIWVIMAVTMESAVFMGKNYLNNCQSVENTTDLTLKQMVGKLRNWCLSKMRSLEWQQLVGRIIHGNICL